MDYIDFCYDGTDGEIYKHIKRTIIDGKLMNMYSIILEGKPGAIDTDHFSCCGYYIINLSLYPFTLQTYLSINRIFFLPVKCHGKELIFLQSISILIIIFYKELNPLTQLIF